MEWKLLAAVINQAIADSNKGDQAATDWLTLDTDGFYYLCEELQFDPKWVRKQLIKRGLIVEPVKPYEPIEEDFWRTNEQ